MKSFPFALLVIAIFVSCNQGNTTHSQQPGTASGREATFRSAHNDSIEILSLLKSVCKWHNKNQSTLPDFDVIIKDSFQTGLNYESFNKTFNALKQTNYFSSSFIDNYKKIADYVNNKLTTANPKYLNEINFSFQEADPWTFFQDEAGNFWDSLLISDYKTTANSASLKWRIQINDWASAGYAVAFLKENDKWKVSWLEGFDMSRL
jgi:hypothetical protein